MQEDSFNTFDEDRSRLRYNRCGNKMKSVFLLIISSHARSQYTHVQPRLKIWKFLIETLRKTDITPKNLFWRKNFILSIFGSWSGRDRRKWCELLLVTVSSVISENVFSSMTYYFKSRALTIPWLILILITNKWDTTISCHTHSFRLVGLTYLIKKVGLVFFSFIKC